MMSHLQTFNPDRRLPSIPGVALNRPPASAVSAFDNHGHGVSPQVRGVPSRPGGTIIMKNGLLIAVGIIIVIVGVIFALQGFGAVGGGFMSNNHTYEVVGPVVALVGLVLAGLGLRRRGSASQ